MYSLAIIAAVVPSPTAAASCFVLPADSPGTRAPHRQSSWVWRMIAMKCSERRFRVSRGSFEVFAGESCPGGERKENVAQRLIQVRRIRDWEVQRMICTPMVSDRHTNGPGHLFSE